MKNLILSFALLSSFFFTACGTDEVAVPQTEQVSNLGEGPSFTSSDVAKLSKAENTSLDAPVSIPTIWEWTSQRCDSLAAAMHFEPLCHERVVLDVVDTISMRFFPEIGKYYEILFVGYQINEQGTISADGYVGWEGHGGGGTCTRYFPNYKQWEIIYGYSYADGVLVAASVYDMRSGDHFSSPPVIWAR